MTQLTKKTLGAFVPFILGLALLPAAHAGDITGMVHYDGPEPKKVPIKLEADPKCVALHSAEPLFSEEEIVANGMVKNVFVYVKNPPKDMKYPEPAGPATLDQKGCCYHPHVQGIRTGQTIKIVNSDNLAHNIRSLPKINPPFNIGQPGPDTREKIMRRPEKAIKINCDVHHWMNSYLFVMDHPFFATTGDDGSFKIEGLPAGEYTVVAWHEKYGDQEMKVTVADGKAAEAHFTYKVAGK
ncbi:carboxypeptidase regulatory-like domain-containing protein [Candidatus Sumerlaeota bacterium]|nr:carboxypeptidase regulatory-like domain-containing protein [Candidatus Sumerlaeota bacterium]